MSAPARRSVLFACNLNSIRSPMAAGLLARLRPDLVVESCGVWEGGYLDPFMVQVMREVGVDLEDHRPKTFADVDLGRFDVILALTGESYGRASALVPGDETTVEYWPLADPTETGETREARLTAYRHIRDDLSQRLQSRFEVQSTKGT